MRAMSIDYDAIHSRFGRDARYLTEIRLWEGSLVTLPANVETVISEVKSRQASVG